MAENPSDSDDSTMLAVESRQSPNYNMNGYRTLMMNNNGGNQYRQGLQYGGGFGGPNQYGGAMTSQNQYGGPIANKYVASAPGQSQYVGNSFAQRTGGVNPADNGSQGAVGGGQVDTTAAGGEPTAAGGLNQAANSLDYDYTDGSAALNPTNRRIAGGGVGISGYGAGGGGYGYGGAGYGGYDRSSGYGHSGGGYGGHSGGHSGGGYGGGGYTPINVISSGYGAVCGDEGLNPALVLGTLIGSALAFAVLFRQVTLGRRKRRNFPDEDPVSSGFNYIIEIFSDQMWKGLEEFEEKIDRIADGQDTTDDSWISRIYNQFVGEYGEVDNALDESDMDGLEPPLLDEKWGLSAALNNKTATEESDKDDTSRTKRDVDDNTVEEEFYDEDIPMELTKGEEKCRVDMWRCLSKVVEGSLHYMDNPDGLMGLAKKTMFKMAFHGGLSNIWSGVMAIPEARQVKRCMNTHEECMAYEILNREVSDSLDPQDPEFQQVQDKMRENLSSTKKRRIMVNPEFVQSLDKSDGAEQYDYDQVEEDADY